LLRPTSGALWTRRVARAGHARYFLARRGAMVAPARDTNDPEVTGTVRVG
jgi:hypothetical protein